MTTSKVLLGLLIVAAGVVLYLYQNKTESTENQPFIAALNANESAINDLDRIVVSQGEQQFDMRESETGWHLNEGFYVRMDSLFKWVQALKDARLIEPKTANPDNFPALSLTDDDLRVRLFQNQQLLADVILGQPSSTPDARFVRFVNNNQSWLASGLNDLSSSKEVWQLALIFDIPANQVQAIEWTAEETLSLIKNPETGQWQQANQAANEKPLNQEKIQTIAAGLSGFRIQDAYKITADSQQAMQTFVFGVQQGRQITLALHGNRDNAMLRITDSQQPDRYQGWQFTVPDYKLSTLLMTQSELFNHQSKDDKTESNNESNDG